MKAKIIIFTCISLLFFSSCQEEPFSANNADNSADITRFSKGKPAPTTDSYPQSVSYTFEYLKNWDQYKGGTMHLPNGSMFFINSGYLTPPEDHQAGKPVTLTMTAEKNSAENQIIYTFGPHGSTFRPAATLTIDWSDLGEDVPVLYYIDEQGNYIRQSPNMIDKRKRKLYVYIRHFSRYAISTE